MLSFTTLAVTAEEAADYLGSAGIAVTLHQTDLMRGQRYIAARFNPRWLAPWGDDGPVPAAVKWAIVEAAVVEYRTPGVLSPVQRPGDKVLVGAGKLQWERVRGAGGADGYVPRIAAVEGLLGPLLRSGSVSFLLRA